jgi:hypothetical protein
MLRASAALLLLLTVAGCSTHTETFNITIRNDTPQPVTVVLAKVGKDIRYEAGWLTPEDIAVESPEFRDKWSEIPEALPPLLPGRSAAIFGLRGVFTDTSHGVVRIYLGEPTISQMIARNAKSFARTEVRLTPGDNWIAVKLDEAGVLVAVPHPPTTQPMLPPK